MINSCLSCSSDLERGLVRRAQGALGDYFCGRCARDGIVCLTYETGLAKLAELIIQSEGIHKAIAAAEAENELQNLCATWSRPDAVRKD